MSGFITEFFIQNKAPAWEVVGHSLQDFAIRELSGAEFLPDGFLEILFKDSPDMLKIIQDLTFANHQLIQLFLKNEYKLESCDRCGYLTRKTLFEFPECEERSWRENPQPPPPSRAGGVDEADTLPANVVAELLKLYAEINGDNLQEEVEEEEQNDEPENLQ